MATKSIRTKRSTSKKINRTASAKSNAPRRSTAKATNRRTRTAVDGN